MRVLVHRCLDCKALYLRIELIGEFYYLLSCLKCKQKYRILISEVEAKGVQVIEHD